MWWKNEQIIQQAQAKITYGIGGVVKKGDVEVVVISQQAKASLEDVVALVPNGNMEEQM